MVAPGLAKLWVDGVTLYLPMTGTGGATLTSTDELLLLVSVSLSVVVTLPVLFSGPAEVGLTTIAMPGAPVGATVPREQMTVVVPEHVPWLVTAETNVTPAGSVSITVTPAAGLIVLLFFTLRP